MKKVWLCLLALMLVLSLCGCKSEEVQNVEAMIETIGTVTDESIKEIDAAMAAYDVLRKKDQEKVENYAVLTDAYDDWLELHIVGEWIDEPMYFYNIEEMYEEVTVTLNDDLTADGECIYGNWRVENGAIVVNDGVYEYLLEIHRENDEVWIGVGNIKLMRKDAYSAILDDMFVIVELTEENVADYCRPIIYVEHEKDAFGVDTNETKTLVTLESTVYEDGLIFMDDADNLAIELLIPEHKTKYTNDGKKWHKYNEDASAVVIRHSPYGSLGYYLGAKDADGYEMMREITVDQITFGRASGKLIFIRKEYVKEIKPDKSGTSKTLVLYSGQEIYTGTWHEDINY